MSERDTHKFLLNAIKGVKFKLKRNTSFDNI